jgi:CIC family chloride channel protein
VVIPEQEEADQVRPLSSRAGSWWGVFDRLRPLRQLLRREGPPNAGFESQRYLAKWLALGILIGGVAGLGAIAFYVGIEWATNFFLGTLVGYHPPAPSGEGATRLEPIARPWLLPLVTGGGALISGILVTWLAPEAEGHGTDAAIAALHYRWGRIRARIPPIKLVASAITIGAGGSGGREGPAAQISAGFGSLLADWLGLGGADRRIAVAAGMGAGIGAIFRAPLGGALMAAEILYIHDLEVEALIPGLIASIVGYSVYGAVFGYTPIFGAAGGLAFDQPIQLVYYALLGLVCGLGGLLYARSFYSIAGAFHRLRLPPWLKPALGGVLVGTMGIVLPGALHMGYGWVQIGMTGDLLGLPLWVVLLLPFAKILATSLSIGSGGSGGIFGPGMVIGGMLGAAFWRLGDGILPGLPATPGPFVIIGMMALFGSIAHAPLAVMLMVAEMTGNLSLLAPAMIAVAIATVLVGDTTIYRSQLPTRAEAPAHRIRFSFPLLSALLVRDAMRAPSVTAGPPAPVTLTPDETLDVALEKLTENGLNTAPVVTDGQPAGQLYLRDIVRTYKQTLSRSVRRVTALTAGTVLFEAQVEGESALVGRALRDIRLPPSTLIVSVVRAGATIFPRADTCLASGDTLLVMTDAASEAAVRTFLEGTSCLLPGARARPA